MNEYEDELQGKVERNELNATSNDVDVNSYQIVFRALKKEPASRLSSQFEDRIIQLVIEKRLKEARRDNFWFCFGLFLIFIAFIVAIALTGFSLNFGFLSAMADYKGLAVFGVIFIAFLNWLDKKLVHRKTPLT
jgi:hypothetical protein